jgi:hypothetical protein
MSAVFNALMTPFKGGRFGASMGRVAFMLTFAMSIWRWCHDRDIPEYMFYFLVISMGYVFCSKLRNVKVGKLDLSSNSKPPKRDDAPAQ